MAAIDDGHVPPRDVGLVRENTRDGQSAWVSQGARADFVATGAAAVLPKAAWGAVVAGPQASA